MGLIVCGDIHCFYLLYPTKSIKSRFWALNSSQFKAQKFGSNCLWRYSLLLFTLLYPTKSIKIWFWALNSSQFKAYNVWVYLFVEIIIALILLYPTKSIKIRFEHWTLHNLRLTSCGSICLWRYSLLLFTLPYPTKFLAVYLHSNSILFLSLVKYSINFDRVFYLKVIALKPLCSLCSMFLSIRWYLTNSKNGLP